MCREGAWDELAVRVTSGIAIRSGMLIKKSCRTDNDCLLYTAFLFFNYTEQMSKRCAIGNYDFIYNSVR